MIKKNFQHLHFPFSTAIHNIFENFKDLEKGKEIFRTSLKEFAAGKDQIFIVRTIENERVINKVANQIKESRQQDKISPSLYRRARSQIANSDSEITSVAESSNECLDIRNQDSIQEELPPQLQIGNSHYDKKIPDPETKKKNLAKHVKSHAYSACQCYQNLNLQKDNLNFSSILYLKNSPFL